MVGLPEEACDMREDVRGREEAAGLKKLCKISQFPANVQTDSEEVVSESADNGVQMLKYNEPLHIA